MCRIFQRFRWVIKFHPRRRRKRTVRANVDLQQCFSHLFSFPGLPLGRARVGLQRRPLQGQHVDPGVHQGGADRDVRMRGGEQGWGGEVQRTHARCQM